VHFRNQRYVRSFWRNIPINLGSGFDTFQSRLHTAFPNTPIVTDIKRKCRTSMCNACLIILKSKFQSASVNAKEIQTANRDETQWSCMNLNLRIFCEHTANDQISHSVRHTVSQSVRQAGRQTDRQTKTAFHLSHNDPLQTSLKSTSTRVRVHQLQQSMAMPLG